MENDYQVSISVQSLKNSKYSHLQHENLKVYEVDILKEGSFDDILQNSIAVVHCASPFKLTSSNPKDEIIKPTIEGTNNIILACKKSKTVKRFILISSAAVIKGKKQDYVYTEKDWNEELTEKEAYPYSKLNSEKLAWDMFKEKNLSCDLVVLNPGFVIGPSLDKKCQSVSYKAVQGVIDGEIKKLHNRPLNIVDVRDVARAVLKSIELKDAGMNRFILASEKSITLNDICKFLKENFKDMKLPNFQDTKNNEIIMFDNSKSKSLIEYTDWKKSVIDMKNNTI